MRSYASWKLLRHVARHAEHNDLNANAAGSARARLRSAIELTTWLHEQDRTLADLRQDLLEGWLLEGGSSRLAIASFIEWLRKTKLITGLRIPRAPRPLKLNTVQDSKRWAILRRLLSDEALDLRERVAGGLLLRYAQPITKMTRLRRSRDLSERHRRSAVQRVGRDGFATAPTARGSGRVRAPRWRSLAHVHPELVAELHPTRNGDLDPETVGAGWRGRPWWRCSTCGHEWQASIVNRTVRGSGCPSCGLRRRVETRSRVEPVRSIATLRPDLAAELHPSRNGAVDPLTVGISSGRALWWSCGTCGHEWEAIVSSRANGTGCPACWSRRRGATFSVVSPERSLAQRAPQVAQELHPTRNPDLDPSVLGARSSRKVWWLCGACGHEWQARVPDPAAGDRCPSCPRAPVRMCDLLPPLQRDSRLAAGPLGAVRGPVRGPTLCGAPSAGSRGGRRWAAHGTIRAILARANGDTAPAPPQLASQGMDMPWSP